MPRYFQRCWNNCHSSCPPRPLSLSPEVDGLSSLVNILVSLVSNQSATAAPLTRAYCIPADTRHSSAKRAPYPPKGMPLKLANLASSNLPYIYKHSINIPSTYVRVEEVKANIGRVLIASPPLRAFDLSQRQVAESRRENEPLERSRKLADSH